MVKKFALSQTKTTENGVGVPKNDAKYDLLKFILSLLVLAIHSNLFPMVLYPWLRIAVPLFFVMSSKFLFAKLQDAPADKHKGILKKFVLRNLQLYLCWFVILLPITIYIRKNIYFSGNILKSMLTIVQDLFFGSTFVASWFIMATIVGVLIIYWLNKLLRNNVILFLIAALSFCIVTLASSYSSAISGTFLQTYIDIHTKIFGGLVCSFPAAIFWVFIGKLIAEQKIKFKSSVLLIGLIICSCIALFIEWKIVISLDGSYNNDSYFMLAPLCLLLFLGVEKIEPFYWKYSINFKRASTIIYVVHGSLVAIVTKLISVVLHLKSPILSFIITLAGCIAVYLFIELLIKKCHKYRINKIFKMLY